MDNKNGHLPVPRVLPARQVRYYPARAVKVAGKASTASKPISSFTTTRVNPSTFLVTENDLYKEHPQIFVKVHPKAPVLIISDTGCDEPSEQVREGKKSAFLKTRVAIHLSLPT